jgi:hypothetical protein
MLKKKEDDGYIYHQMSLIENKKRKQYVYFLTNEGVNFAKELKIKYPNYQIKTLNNDFVQKQLIEFL